MTFQNHARTTGSFESYRSEYNFSTVIFYENLNDAILAEYVKKWVRIFEIYHNDPQCGLPNTSLFNKRKYR